MTMIAHMLVVFCVITVYELFWILMHRVFVGIKTLQEIKIKYKIEQSQHKMPHQPIIIEHKIIHHQIIGRLQQWPIPGQIRIQTPIQISHSETLATAMSNVLDAINRQ